MKTFFTDQTGAQHVAEIFPGVDDTDTVAPGCVGQGGVVAGRSGSDHDHIFQIWVHLLKPPDQRPGWQVKNKWRLPESVTLATGHVILSVYLLS